MTCRTISRSKWFDEFKPVGDGVIFPNVSKDTDPLKVWTYLSDGDGEWVMSGYHFINRMGFYITEVARKENEEITVYEDWLVEELIQECEESARKYYEL